MKLSRHLLYGLGGVLAGGALAALARPDGLLHLLSLATGYATFGYFCATLLIGPLRVIRGGRPLLSGRTRRHTGIWCGVFALLHVALGLNVHLGGDYAAYFFVPASPEWRPRSDAFGIANDLGLVATLGVVLLLALSNNASLRALGSARWKAWQRSAYPIFVIVVVHAVMYQSLERRQQALIVLTVAMTAAVCVLQCMAFARLRASPGFQTDLTRP